MSKLVEVETLQLWLAEGKPVTVLDVRPREQYDEWRIPGSVHVDAYGKLKAGDEEVLRALDLPTNRPVVTVCVSGNTSQVAADQLERRGLDVSSLTGGMKAWSFAWNKAVVSLPNGVEVVQVRRAGKGCLSYLVSSQQEALVIDPSLDQQVYLDLARDLGVEIVGILDTHLHADHLSRANHLATTLGVPRYLPAQDRVNCPHTPLGNGDVITFGKSKLEVLLTPGHTWESSTFAIDGALFTGDTLFTDSVGRPDLEAAPEEARKRALVLYDSLQRLTSLPGETLVLPAHADEPPDFSGTPWAARISDVRAKIELLQLERDAFADYLTDHAQPAPANHTLIVQLNEACELPQAVGDLEAGANRCAIH
ncbi:MAG: rhodanese-like domain-containing protein [Trueperaceae bacterium]